MARVWMVHGVGQASEPIVVLPWPDCKGLLELTAHSRTADHLGFGDAEPGGRPTHVVVRVEVRRHGHAGLRRASLFVPWRPTRPQLGLGAEARKRLTSPCGSVCLNRIKAPLRNGTSVPIGPGQDRGRDAGEVASRRHARSKDEGPLVFAEAARFQPAMPASLFRAAPCVRKTGAHRVSLCKHRHGAGGQAGSALP